MATEFTAPTGRLVWGDPFKAETVMDDLTKLPKRDAAGNVVIEYTFGVAYTKGDAAFSVLYATFKGADRAEWPQFHGADGNILPGVKFADKITDGDGFNQKGQQRAKEGNGYAGCWIVKYATQFPPNVYEHDGQRWVQMVDNGRLQPGDYVQVSGSTQSNKSQQSPGMYRNANMVAFVGKGVPIVRTGDPDKAFGAAPPPLPPGATPAPQLPPGPGAPLTPPAPAPGPAATRPAPYTGYVPGPAATPGPPAAPPMPPAPPAAPVNPQRQMTAAANGVPYEAYVQQGWTDLQMIQAGLLVDYIPH